MTGVSCSDTQTGLRGIPRKLIPLAAETHGSRYEYEMNFLSDAAERCEMVFVPIETVYEDNNSCSHFRPIRDSLRVYGRMIRFMISSLTGSVVDYFIFAVMLVLLPFAGMSRTASVVVAATVIARLFSGIVNFIMNKKFAFRSAGDTGSEGFRYLILFICQMGASAALVSALSAVITPIVAKVIVDTSLFFASYFIQKRWVFSRRKSENIIKERTRTVAIGVRKGAGYEG